MSKKNKKFRFLGGSALALNSEQQVQEYSIIKRDLLKVLLINVLFLAAVLSLYFTNQKTHYLEAWASKFLNF